MSTRPLLIAICTHNPRPEPLVRTLVSLRNQTLSRDLWALRLFDNASTNGVPAGMDLSWHPDARLIPAPKLGVAHARRLVFDHAAEIGAKMILFVDDDNLLDPDYLETGLGIGHADSRLGCWGGQMIGEYGAPAPEWLGRFEKYLAVSPGGAGRGL